MTKTSELKQTAKNTKFELDILKDAYFQLSQTSKKLTESKANLAISDESFKAIFENSQDAIMTLKPPSWKFTSCNPATLKMFLVKNQDHFANYVPWLKLSPKYQPDGNLSEIKAKEMIAIAMKKGSNLFEWLHRRLNGETFPASVLLTKVVLPGNVFCQATVRDMTESKKAEEKILASEEKFKTIFEGAIDGIAAADISTQDFVFVNKSMCLLTGYTAKELVKLNIRDIHPKKGFKSILNIFKDQAKGTLEVTTNMPVVKRNGEIIYCDISAKKTFIDGQELIIGFFRDVTNRYITENKLIESEYFFRKSQQVASIGSYDLNFVSGLWTSSDVLDSIFGIDKNYLKSVNGWLKIVAPMDRKMMDEYFQNEVIKGHNKFSKEYRIRRVSDGAIRWVSGLGDVFYDGEGKPTHMIGTIQDVTVRVAREQENQLLASFPILNPNPIIEIVKNDGITYINPAAKKVFPDLLKKQINHPFVRGLKDLISNTSADNVVIHSSPIEPREVFVKGHWYLEYFSNPTPGILRVYAVDITKLKDAQEKISQDNARSESILESIGDAVFACDKKGKIILFNRIAELLTGKNRNQVIGKHYNKVVNFVRESDGKPCNDFIAESIKNKVISEMANHAMLAREDGIQIPIADSAAPITDSAGNVVGCVVVFHEMTKERKIDKAKTEFVSLASHQLRTPLSTINWYSEILLSEDIGLLNPKQKQYSHEVYHASQRMVSLVNALLNVSRIELGTFAVEPKPVNIIKIAKMYLKELKPQIVFKKLIVKEKYDRRIAPINVDPKLMGIIFQNLFSNAIKYSKKGGKVEITIDQKEDNLLTTVADSGIGIPTNQQKEIFTKLFRADNAKTTDPDGSGLGLYIVKEIINYTGGAVWFESKEGKGSKFYASLPMSGMKKNDNTKQLIQ